MSDKKSDDKKISSASYMDELGAAAAEAICASLKAANDDAPNFGPSLLGASFGNTHDARTLANALVQLRSNTFTKKVGRTPSFKGKFAQNFRLILGTKDE